MGADADMPPPGEMISGALTSQTDDLLPVPAGSTLNTQEWLQRLLGKRYVDNVMRLTSALQ